MAANGSPLPKGGNIRAELLFFLFKYGIKNVLSLKSPFPFTLVLFSVRFCRKVSSQVKQKAEDLWYCQVLPLLCKQSVQVDSHIFGLCFLSIMVKKILLFLIPWSARCAWLCWVSTSQPPADVPGVGDWRARAVTHPQAGWGW